MGEKEKIEERLKGLERWERYKRIERWAYRWKKYSGEEKKGAGR